MRSGLLRTAATAVLFGGAAPLPAAGQRSPERAAHVVEILRLGEGQTVADIGAGSGWLSEAVARALGPDGTVFAVEIEERPVEWLRDLADRVHNVVPVHSRPEDVRLARGSVDVAFLHDVASHVQESARPRFYASIARALREDGRLVIFGPHGKARELLDELRDYRFHPEDGGALTGLSDAGLDARLEDGIRFLYLPRRRGPV